MNPHDPRSAAQILAEAGVLYPPETDYTASWLEDENTVWLEFWLIAGLVILAVFGLGIMCGVAWHG